MDATVVGAVMKEGALALLLLVNMVYLGRKIDRLTEAVWKTNRRRAKR